MREAARRYGVLADYSAVRDVLLARIGAELTRDTRVRSAWLSGSFGRGEVDAWADLDLHVAVADEHFAAFLNERDALYHRVGNPILVQGEMASDAMPAARFQLVLFDGPVEVDWNIGPVSLAVRPLAYQMVVNRAPVPVVEPPALDATAWHAQASRWTTFFWAMAPIAAKYAGRADTRRAAGQIGLLSTAYIALWRLLHDADAPDPLVYWTNRVMEPELDAALPQLGAVIDPVAMLATIRALCDAVEHLHPALAQRGVAIPMAMAGQVAALCNLAELVLRDEIPARRVYR